MVDISWLQLILEKAKGYGYRMVGFILDRGYFGKENIQYMDQCGYDFVIMIKAFVKELLLGNRGCFENKREHSIRKYRVSGTTVKGKLYEGEGKERYFYIFYSDQKAGAEHEQIESRIDRMAKYLDKIKGKKVTMGEGFKQYFHIETYEKDGTFLYAREKTEVIQQEIGLYGYFVIITSKNMTEKEAIELYKSRDASEKLFRGTNHILEIRACGCRQMRRQVQKS